MSHDSSAPATKQDVGMLMEEMGKIHISIADLQGEMRDMRGEMHDMEHRLLVNTEQIRSDVVDMYHDKIQQHDERIVVVEMRLGIKP